MLLSDDCVPFRARRQTFRCHVTSSNTPGPYRAGRGEFGRGELLCQACTQIGDMGSIITCRRGVGLIFFCPICYSSFSIDWLLELNPLDGEDDGGDVSLQNKLPSPNKQIIRSRGFGLGIKQSYSLEKRMVDCRKYRTPNKAPL